MAQAYLEGGPCNGTLHTIDLTKDVEGQVTCKGGLYKIVSPTEYHNGHAIFKYAGPVASTTPPGVAAHAHKGWADLRRSVNHVMPRSLGTAQKSTAAGLRTVARARRVKLK